MEAVEVHAEVQEEAKVVEEEDEDALDHQEIGSQGIQEFF